MYQIVKKAWKINPINLLERYDMYFDDIYYGTRGQAKQQILVDYDACTVTSTNKPIDYLSVKLSRVKSNDIILYNGEKIKRYMVEEIERKNNIKNLPKDKFYYVQDKRSYVGNAVLWWGKNGNGYVCNIHDAHKYSYEELQNFNPRDTDVIWDADHVMNASKLIVDAQYLQKEFSL